VNLPAPEPNRIDLFALPLHEAGIRYLVAGSVGSMHYSEPRLTLDIDIPLFVTHKDIPTILKCFSEPEYYCPPADVIASEIARDISKKIPDHTHLWDSCRVRLARVGFPPRGDTRCLGRSRMCQ